MDAAHFVHGAFLGFVWSFCRIFIPSPSGRKRFNVLGALNATTKEIHTVTNTTYIDSVSVCAMLDKLAGSNGDIPTTIVLDNARYQRCRKVQDYAMELGVELLFLPSYSPNLNLIERLWRYVKNESLYSKYYETFDSFREAIDNCLNKCRREDLESLLTLNFQLFDEVYISAA